MLPHIFLNLNITNSELSLTTTVQTVKIYNKIFNSRKQTSHIWLLINFPFKVKNVTQNINIIMLPRLTYVASKWNKKIDKLAEWNLESELGGFHFLRLQTLFFCCVFMSSHSQVIYMLKRICKAAIVAFAWKWKSANKKKNGSKEALFISCRDD